MKKLLLSCILIWATLQSNAQSFRELFVEANLLSEDGYYGLAIPLWETLLAMDPGNANINYKIGKCYIKQDIDRQKALPYLLEASKGVKKVYDPFTADFKTAPQETYYWLGLAYHIENELEKAEEMYSKFLELASKKHINKNDAERGIIEIEVARRLMANPLKVEVKNLGGPINTEFAEYSPITALDENTIYFTSRRLRPDSTNEGDFEATTGLYFEDMYVSFRNISGRWMEPELLPMNVPGEHSSVVSMSKDGRTLFIYRIYNGVGNIYVSHFKLGEGWSAPELVGGDVNSPHNEFFAAITADESRLYFVSDRPGGMGGKDIWYCNRLPDGQWGKAINMGKPVNTKQDEDAPFIHPDGKTFYFASNGHETMGGYDIFFSQIGEEDTWLAPENMGYPINSTDNDHSFITSPSGKRGYYASRGKTGFGSTDIYVIDFMESEPSIPEVDMTPFAVLKGFVYEPLTSSTPDNMRIEMRRATTQELVGTAHPVTRNGSFVFIIPSGEAYTLEYFQEETSLFKENVEIPSGQLYQELNRELFLYNEKDKLEVVSLDQKTLGPVKKWRLKLPENSSTLALGSRIMYIDDEGNTAQTAYVSKEGYFEFVPLNAEVILKPAFIGSTDDVQSFQIELVMADGSSETRTMKLHNGLYYEEGKEPKPEKDEVIAENASNESPKEDSTIQAKNTTTQPKEELPKKKAKMMSNASTAVSSKPQESSVNYDKSVTIYMNFNQVDALSDEPDFLAAIELLEFQLKNKPNSKAVISASASKVPTSKFSSNQALADARLASFKSLITKALTNKGLDINDFSTVVEKAKVSGPGYNVSNGDMKTDYIEFQYISIEVN